MTIRQTIDEYFTPEYRIEDNGHTIAIAYCMKDAETIKKALEEAREKEKRDEDAWLAS